MNNEIFKSPEAFREQLKAVQSSGNSALEAGGGLTQAEVSTPAIAPVIEADNSGEANHQSDVKDDPAVISTHDNTPNETNANSHLVPKSRFNQEVEKRKEVESKLQQEREKAIRAEARAEELTRIQTQGVQNTVAAEPKQPDIIPLDTEAHTYYQKKIADLEQKVNSVAQQTSSETQRLYQLNMLNAQETNFMKKQPDYPEALKHIKEVELNIAKEFIPDESKAEAYVLEKLKGMAQVAMNSGKNTAETVYNVAKTYGYKPAPESRNKSESASRDPNIDAINRNAPRSANVNGVGGSAVGVGGTGGINIESALAQPDNKYSRVDPIKFREILKKHEQRQYPSK